MLAAALVFSWLYMNAVIWGLIRLDERYLCDEARLEKAWPPSSRDAAIIGFGPIALVLHFLRTRISFTVRGIVVGVPLGLAMAAAALVALFVALTALDAVFSVLGLPDQSD
jgi:hypothetical protein